MCLRRLALLANIDTVPLAAIYAYLKRLSIVYTLLLALAAYNLYVLSTRTSYGQELAIVGLVAYAVLVASLLALSILRTLTAATVACLNVLIMLVFYIVRMVLNVISALNYEGSNVVQQALLFSAGLSIVSIMLMASTLYIVVKLRIRIQKEPLLEPTQLNV